VQKPVPGFDRELFLMVSEQGSVQTHRSEAHDSCEGSDQDQCEVQTDLKGVELLETLLKGECEQKARDDLGAGLRDSQFLEYVPPVAVRALVRGLLSTVSIGVVTGTIGMIGHFNLQRS
jgi:hypothetical protein